MDLFEEVVERHDEFMQIAIAHAVTHIQMFGSVVRGEETPESDLDFLVEFQAGRSLLDQVALVQDLEDLFGRSVDVVTEGGLHWYIKEQVLQEAVSL